MIAGFGGGLGFSQALDYLSNFILNSGFFKEYGAYSGRTFPSLGGPILVVAGTIIGAGVGMLICSAMHDDRSNVSTPERSIP